MYTAKIGKAFWKGTIVPTLLHGMAVWAKKKKEIKEFVSNHNTLQFIPFIPLITFSIT